MTDSDLANQIIGACEASLKRFQAAVKTKDFEQVQKTTVSEYLSGISQTCYILTRADGDVTPQQIERALALVAKKLNLESGAPT